MFVMAQAQTRSIRKKAETVSLSAEFFTLALRGRLPVKHPAKALLPFGSPILAGFFCISQSAIRQMLCQRFGHIVNISTSVVDQPIAGVPCALQALTKGGLHAVTRALAIEYAGAEYPLGFL
jgi:NAD(P)-dependent dehydrogenase (short-subunit alcohol dehydrogenase family)